MGKYDDIDEHLSIPAPGEQLVDLRANVRNGERSSSIITKKNIDHPFNTQNATFEIDGKILPLNLENVLLNEEIINTLPDSIFLRKGAMAVEIIDKTLPRLAFLPWVRTVETDQLVVTYLRFLTSAHEDREDPGTIVPSGQFPDISRGLPVERQATLSKKGFQVKFTHDAIINVASSFDYIDHNIEYAAHSYAAYLNDRIGVVLTNNWSTTQSGNEAIRIEAADAVWDNALADPIKDILDLKRKMQGSGGDAYYVEPTDLFLTQDNFRELLDYLRTVSQQWAQAPYGDVPSFSLYGIRIHSTPDDAGMEANKGVMLSNPATSPPVTMYHRSDANFSRVGTLHTHEFMRDDNHDHVFQFWDYIGLVNQVPQKVGMLYNM